MTDIDSMIAVLMAAKEGKVIQWRVEGCTIWNDNPLAWDFQTYRFRVKPEPVVRRIDAHQDYANYIGKPNLELEFIEGKLVGAKVL